MRFIQKFKNKKGMAPYKYDNGKIYKISSKHSDKVYIGSTCQKLNLRFSLHKSNYKLRKYNVSVHNLFDLGDCKIELIENYPCKNRKELEMREGWQQKNNKNCLNIRIAGNGGINKNIPDNPDKKIKCECSGFYYESKKEKHFKTASHIKILSRIRKAKEIYHCIECNTKVYANRKNIHLNSWIHKQ